MDRQEATKQPSSPLVRIFKAGSPVGRLIQSVLENGADEDAAIREAAECDARSLLNKGADGKRLTYKSLVAKTVRSILQ